jgi:1-deoxy-D-xylulose-5-phosphate reductoisomerase
MKIVLLGSTGSIGMSACNCIRRFPQRFSLVAVSAKNKTDQLLRQAREFCTGAVCVGDTSRAQEVQSGLPSGVRVFWGEAGLEQLVNETDFDVLLNALVGAVGLRATVAALKRNKCVALANKESLVVGGDYITSLLNRGMGQLIPVDSEHSAIQQCLSGEDISSVESIILTASGGPFRELPLNTMASVTPADALNHPTWTMGKKITIDSATLVNKGFEIMEAHHLFAMPYDRLRVVIHPQSIIHSMVEFHDGAVMAQLGVPDMELPIQYALSFPKRLMLKSKRLNLVDIGTLTFSEPDFNRFPCLKLCLEAGIAGGTAPVVLNAANEIAVQAFLDGRIRFNQIAQTIEAALNGHEVVRADDLETIEKIDKETRISIEHTINSVTGR